MALDLVMRAAWLVPVTAPPIAGGFVALQGERIVDLGPGEGPRADRVLDFGAAAIMPAFVNAHTHLGCAFLRGEIDDAGFLDWLTGDVTPRVMTIVEDDRALLESCALEAARELAAGGIGTVADCFFDDCGRRALEQVGLRGIFFREIFGSRADDLDDYAARMTRRYSRDRAELVDDLRGYGIAPHAPYTVPLEVMRAAVELARAGGSRVSIHLAESVEEVEFFRRGGGPMRDLFAAGSRASRYRFGAGPARMLADEGLLGPESILVHAVQVDADELEAIASSRASVVHCPSSNARLAVGIAPVEEMLAAGISLALGTDSPASTGKLDMFEEMRLAIALQRLRLGRPGRLDSARVLEMATLGGARALGLEDRIGSLEIGKLADLAVVDLGRPTQARVRDPIAAIVHGGLPSDIRLLLVGGREPAPEAP